MITNVIRRPRSVGPSAARLVLVLATLATSCDRGPAERPRQGQQAGGSRVVEEAADETPTANTPTTNPPVLGDAPRFEMTDQSGRPFASQRLAGTVWVANFMPAAAGDPGMTETLAALQDHARRWPDRDRLMVLSFATDPKRQTVESLRLDAESRQANAERWKLLIGDQRSLTAVRRVFAALAPEPAGGPPPGATQLFLIDARGRVRGFYDGGSDDGFRKLTADARTVLSESAPGVEVVHVGNPADVFDPAWLEPRRAAQLSTRDEIEVYHDFGFEDRVEESGIRFVSRAVADAARDFKSNHYDHANGLAAADVDGDGLGDLYFLSQVGGNQLWRNLGGGRFEDVTAASGVSLAGRVSVSASFADTDNDGDPDLFVTTTRHGNAFFENVGAGKFRDATADSGLGYVGHSSAGDFFDYDGDGLLDLLLTNVGVFTSDEIGYSGNPARRESAYYVGLTDAFGGHLYPKRSEPCVLYRNEGGNRFRGVTEEAGLSGTGWAGDATPIDTNGDGRLDLYILDMQGNDDLYVNRGGRRFERADEEAFSQSVWGGMGVKSFDYDNDGMMDLFVTNMHADMWQLKKEINGPDEKKKPPADVMPESYLRSRKPGTNVLGNALYKNLGSGRFEEVSDATGAETYWPWGPSVGDLNADGYQDVFVTSCMNYPYRYHVNTVLLNEQGRAFREAEFILGVEPRRDGRTAAPWFELDCSGRDVDHPLCQGRTGRVVVWGAVGSRSSVVFDLDGDGDLDIVTNDFNTEPMVLISDLAARKEGLRYLSVRMRGVRSNRDGLGAKVRVTAGGRTLTQIHDGQSGYLSQSSLPLYFGLGETQVVDEIAIEWLGGGRQLLRGPIETNRTLEVVEAAEAAAL